MYVGFTSGMNDISALSSSVHWFCGTPLPKLAQGGIMNLVNYRGTYLLKGLAMEIHIQDCHRYMFAAILDILGF